MGNIYVKEFNGYKIYFTNSSYNCPQLKLYGYSTEKKLITAIKRKG